MNLSNGETNNPLHKKRIILGITGSIACYKAADLASKLSQAGAQVTGVLTRGAQKFISPLTIQSVSGNRAYTDADLWGSEAHVLHIGLGHKADFIVVAPATANTIAKLAQGISDNLLCVTSLSANCPLLLAPAMDGGMYNHPATGSNLRLLEERGAIILGPEAGHLASGLTAVGRMSEPSSIVDQIRYQLSRQGPLSGCKIVVTAGGTREPLDPVRFLTNHSSGKQGYAVAQAALDAGADVTLITTVKLPHPTGITVIDVDSAEQMASSVLAEAGQAHALLMAAAVADYRPARAALQKIKKSDGSLTLELTPNIDILMAVAEARGESAKPDVVVGFAAETENLQRNAAGKLKRKKLDMIVANDVSASDAGFGVDTNRVTFVHQDGTIEELPLMSKREVAIQVILRLTQLLRRNST